MPRYRTYPLTSSDSTESRKSSIGSRKSEDVPPSRFSRTLREVMHDDYMPEITQLKRRIKFLEEQAGIEGNTNDSLLLSPIDSEVRRIQNPNNRMNRRVEFDDRLNDLLENFNAHVDDTNTHLTELDDAIVGFVNSIGVCAYFIILLLFILNSFCHTIIPIYSYILSLSITISKKYFDF